MIGRGNQDITDPEMWKLVIAWPRKVRRQKHRTSRIFELLHRRAARRRDRHDGAAIRAAEAIILRAALERIHEF